MLTYRATHRPPPAPARLSMAEELARPAALATAIDRDQLRLFYQPIVELSTSAVIGHEVLVRWQHPDYGLLSPDDFLPSIDRDIELSRTLGNWILGRSCAVTQNQDLSINISPLHLTDPTFAALVAATLHDANVSPDRLILELTAPSVVWPSPTVIATCRTLRELGVRFAVDQIGLNQPTTHTLDELPLGLLKIARSVVGGIGIDSKAEAAAVATIRLAEQTGRDTIAVGVETHAQGQFLREQGATYAQGHLFGRPQPR